jgi:5-methyltetrahydropteroyltriglutamate--homocysteine methyltransferase
MSPTPGILRSTERILTTHTGSLPRPPALRDALRQGENGTDDRSDRVLEEARWAVEAAVAAQLAAGIDIVNDGEMGRVNYATYVVGRLSGFGSQGSIPIVGDAVDYPEWAKSAGLDDLSNLVPFPACVGPIAYDDDTALRQDIERLQNALPASSKVPLFMSSVSPGVIAGFLEDQYYGSHRDYVAALADAMKHEYDVIHQAGLILQIDCPDLAMGRHYQFRASSLEEWREVIAFHVERLNNATRDIPPESMRMHVCWGNYAGPHHLDVPLEDVIDIVLEARPATILLEAANPRHEHEWRVFQDLPLPEGKVLVPGVIDTTTNYIEHPRVVADRIVNFARVVGRENVLAGTDCGFGSSSEWSPVDTRIVYAKLRALVDGAALASRELWQ